MLQGTPQGDTLTGYSTADGISGLGGNDRLSGGGESDTIDGGDGLDTINGEAGNDTYLFRRGSGEDMIVDADATVAYTQPLDASRNPRVAFAKAA